MGILHRVWTNLSEEKFYRMLNRARTEDCFVGGDGKVDIGKLLDAILTSYGDGTYCILPPKKNTTKEHVERFHHPSIGSSTGDPLPETPKSICSDDPLEPIPEVNKPKRSHKKKTE